MPRPNLPVPAKNKFDPRFLEAVMQRFANLAKPVSHVLIAAFLMLGLHLPAAQAAIVGTGALLQSERGGADRAQLRRLLDRADVKAALVERGVDPGVVQARVNALTDDEAHTLAAKIDQLPAGGSDILLLGVVVFLVLLFTDIMGYTDIFPFVKKHAQ
jgi:Family of unknown function (DUF6627)